MGGQETAYYFPPFSISFSNFCLVFRSILSTSITILYFSLKHLQHDVSKRKKYVLTSKRRLRLAILFIIKEQEAFSSHKNFNWSKSTTTCPV